MPSNENCEHNLPHVHVVFQNQYDAVISLKDAKILHSNLPGKYERKAIKTVKERQAELFDYWDKHTNGFTPDINAAWNKKEILASI